MKKDPSCGPVRPLNCRSCADLPVVIKRLVQSCREHDGFAHISPAPIPSREKVLEIITLCRHLLFPGYFENSCVEEFTLEYHLGQEAANLFQTLSTQISAAIRHDCYRNQAICTNCDERGQAAALQFMQALPDMHRLLAGDVRAAYEGDPASSSYDEIIFCYPGLLAIMVHRLAHLLYKLQVPLLPRIMSEAAHNATGIDIHPGAEIGESFFIDHGTGVVIGQTAVIGERVRIYQGVTLGALSLPRDTLDQLRHKKRHPTIEDEVIIYSGATILGGNTVVGARSIIGGNTWITASVPPDTRVLLKAPEQIYLGNGKSYEITTDEKAILK